MSSRQAERPGTLSRQAVIALHRTQVESVSRRALLRRSLAAGIGLWLTEVAAGTLGFLWANLAGGFGGKVVVGDLTRLTSSPANPAAPVSDGAPAHIPEARAFISLVDPTLGVRAGDSPQGDGAATNVRTLYQRCTHLGCTPNFCERNFWFECPCHGSRFDRLGIKVQNLGPAPRGLDRFAHVVDVNGVLTVDTGSITLGPLPVALGQPGVLPPRTPTGCL
jgi:cytochrome b6-f complex iron-sulfur subunit